MLSDLNKTIEKKKNRRFLASVGCLYYLSSYLNVCVCVFLWNAFLHFAVCVHDYVYLLRFTALPFCRPYGILLHSPNLCSTLPASHTHLFKAAPLTCYQTDPVLRLLTARLRFASSTCWPAFWLLTSPESQ